MWAVMNASFNPPAGDNPLQLLCAQGYDECMNVDAKRFVQ